MTTVGLTTLLGTVMNAKSIQYNPATGSIQSPLPRDVFYKWEARLAQCAFLSRLIYTPSELFLRGVQYLDYAPDVCNNIVSLLEHTFYKQQSFDQLFVSQGMGPVTEKVKRGHFFPKTGCAIFQHYNLQSKINSEKTCYVVFKGSSSMKDFMSDAKIAKLDLSQIPQLAGMPGTIHYGFYAHMRDEVSQILARVIELSAGCDRVYITGHSLGGAMSTLFSMILARAKELGAALPTLHCVTFGAPNLLSDEARNVYNKYLLDGSMTLDRVTTDKDIIVPIPGAFFSHPGFSLLNTELYPTKKTGRAMSVDDIRAVFLGSANVVKRKSMMGSLGHSNELPADPVFWNLFQQVPGDAPLDMRLKNFGRMKREVNMEFAKFILSDKVLSPSDLPVELTSNEEAATEKMNADQLKADSDALEATVAQASTQETVSQVGGLFESDAKKLYKQAALSQYPSRVKYQCYQRIAAGFCHAVYMGIGFVAAVRVPSLTLRDPVTKKLSIRPVRKLEPTLQTEFVALTNAYNPSVRYYSMPVATAGGKRTLSKRNKRKALRNTRRK